MKPCMTQNLEMFVLTSPHSEESTDFFRKTEDIDNWWSNSKQAKGKSSIRQRYHKAHLMYDIPKNSQPNHKWMKMVNKDFVPDNICQIHWPKGWLPFLQTCDWKSHGGHVWLPNTWHMFRKRLNSEDNLWAQASGKAEPYTAEGWTLLIHDRPHRRGALQ